tara:strand:+ start:246 stop:497 length:252 start_codon:yes stop_codon:yes gene_type:complete
MSIQSSYKKKLKEQIEILYESIAKSLDKKIQDAVHNLILFGYTDFFDCFYKLWWQKGIGSNFKSNREETSRFYDLNRIKQNLS